MLIDNKFKNRTEKKVILETVFAFVLPFLLMVTLQILFKYAPFGDGSFAGGDINNTQLDIYGYLKDVLTGNNTPGYSFSMGLGGDTMNLFAYSMSAPLNFLVVFFQKKDFLLFFNIMVVLQVPFTSVMMSYFIRKRFQNGVKSYINVLLSAGYALSGYGIYQIMNLYWLSGMMLLPIMMLGEYRLIRDRKIGVFSISIALSILFNWYTAAINCIFAVGWFLFETLLLIEEERKFDVKRLVRSIGRVIYSGLAGVLIGCVLLLPVIGAISKGNRGSFNWNMLAPYLNGALRSSIGNSGVGTVSTPSMVTIYCGSLAIIACASFFFTKERFTKKIIVALMLFAVTLTFYWQPLTILFSMMKYASSFYFRFGYIAPFAIIFTSASFLAIQSDQEKKIALVIGTFVYTILFVLINHMGEYSTVSGKQTVLTVVSYIGVLMFLFLYYGVSKTQIKYLCSMMLIIMISFELLYNAKIVWNRAQSENGTDTVSSYSKYVSSEEKLINSLKEYDDGIYRINKSPLRQQVSTWSTCHYCEPLNYGYWGISSYTNTPDDRQREMLQKFGYRMNGENYYIVNTSIVPIDSLLGVKYYLSDEAISGYIPIDDISTENNKVTYVNPYALPIAFLYNTSVPIIDGNNPFEYTNNAYSSLLGEKVEVFKKLEVESENTDAGIEYTIDLSNVDSNLVYANFPWNDDYTKVRTSPGDYTTNWQGMYNGVIKLNGENLMVGYANWGSPSVLHIPTGEDDSSITIAVEKSSEDAAMPTVLDAEIYAVDLNVMEQISNVLKDSVVQESLDGNTVSIDADLQEEQTLFTSIPYDSGWVITDNGKKIDPVLFSDCLMNFELSKGEHHIVMKYKVPLLREGVICGFFGVMMLIVWFLVEKRNKKNR